MERTQTCSSCGRKLFPDDTFCSQCGTKVQEESSRAGFTRRTHLRKTIPPQARIGCGSCNSPLLTGEIFCPTCGARAPTTTPSGPTGSRARASNLRKLEEGTRGRFEFIRELGRGGMGAVYLARELDLDRLVAIKALSSNWLTDESMVERFRREARVIASLRHPSVVHVHGVGQVEDVHYFIMDFIDGVSLGQILRTHGQLSIPAIHAVFYEVGSALSYAHRPGRGVIHRDVKPSNIMLDREGSAFVTDFGISKVAETQSGLTATGLIMGTPEYMSPEQCRGDRATFAADQYALGVVLFAMLAGTPPFSGPHFRVLTGHTSESPPPIQDLRPDCPPELADVVNRMLEKQPGERWPDITDALRAAGVRPMMPDDPVRKEMVEVVAQTRLAEISQPSRVGKQEAPDKEKTERTPTTLRILAPEQSLEAGEEVKLTATALFPDGEEVEGQTVIWDSTDPSVARIDPSTGELVAVGEGSAVITASSAGVAESIAIEVSRPRVARLVIEPDWLELEVGASAQLTALAASRRGEVLDRVVLWSSSDPGRATATEEGLVRGHQAGLSTILAHCEGVGASVEVTIIPASVASVQLRGVPPALHLGESVLLRLEVRDSRENVLDRPAFWSTSDPGVARISDAGELRALAPGVVRITGECGGQSASTTLNILPVPVAQVIIPHPQTVLQVGERVRLAGVAVDASGQELDREIRWESGDETVLDVTTGGWVEGLEVGWAEVLSTCEGVTARVGIEVRPATPVGTIPPREEPAAEGLRTEEFVPHEAAWEGAGDTTLEPTLVASSGEDGEDRTGEAGADRSPLRHLLWALPLAAVVSGGGLWLALGRDRPPPPPPAQDPSPPALVAASLSVFTPEGDPAEAGLQLVEGDTVSLSAIVVATTGDTILQPDLAWSTDDEGLARVDAGGTLVALAAGPLTVTVTVDTVNRELPVEVTPRRIEPPITTPPPPPNGELVLVVRPFARVLIDGVLKGEDVQNQMYSLAPGRHTLRLENPNMVPFDTVFEIRSNTRTQLSKTMQRRR